MDILNQDIKYLPGVGPNRKKMLSNELGIESYGDLLEYYPYKYVDRSKVYTIHELTGDMPFVQVVGHILSFETFPMGPRKERVVAHFTDGTGICDLTWFNGGKYAKQNYKIGTSIWCLANPLCLTTASTSPIPTWMMRRNSTSPPWDFSPITTPPRR